MTEIGQSLLELNFTRFGISDSPRVISVVCSLFERIVAKNERWSPKYEPPTVFHGLKVPSISIKKYLERIFKYAHCSPSCFVVAYAYIDRLINQSQAGFSITSLNIHRLLMTSVMVAAKFLDDMHYNNAYYAKVGGVMTMEMNRLELQFLFQIGFRLHVTADEFERYCTLLEREVVVIERAFHFNSKEEDPDRKRTSAWCTYAGV